MFPSSESLRMATRSSKDGDSVLSFIKQFRSSLQTDIIQSGEYAFKAFLVQVANHKSNETLPIQFYAYDQLDEEEKKKVEKIAALIKERHIPVANDGKFKPGLVVEKVQNALGNITISKGKKVVDKFNLDTHTRCWKKYEIRPAKGSEHPERTNATYCTYDAMNKNYGYTQAWVDFLIEQMNIEDEYNSLFQD